MKRCVNCNQLEGDDSRFCSRCGGQILEEAGSPVKKTPRKLSSGQKAIAVTLCLFMTVVAGLASLVLLLRASVSEDALETAMSRVFDEEDLADLQIGELVGAKKDDTTIAEYVYSMLDEQSQTQISEKEIEELLNESFVQDFMTEKMSDYLSDALYDNKKGKIKTEEIMELLKDNDKKIQKLTGIPMSEVNLREVENYIEDNDILKEVKLSAYTREYKSEFSTLRFFFSDKLRLVLIALGILLLAGVFLVLPDRVKACGYVGIVFIVVGCMNMLVVFMSVALPGIADNVLPLGEDIYKQLFASLRLHSVIQTLVVMAIGVACVLFAKCCKRKFRA